MRGTSRAAAPWPYLDAVRKPERRTQTGILLHPSPLTPGPSPTTASLADARGAAGERGENVVFYKKDVYSPLPRSLASLSESGFGGEGLGVRGTSRAAPPPTFAVMGESERRTQTVILLHPSPLTPGPSPTTASLADARGAAGERGENVAFDRAEPYMNSAGVSKSRSSNRVRHNHQPSTINHPPERLCRRIRRRRRATATESRPGPRSAPCPARATA